MKVRLWIGGIVLAAIWLAAIYVVFFTPPGRLFPLT
jgi:hypothetical protein